MLDENGKVIISEFEEFKHLCLDYPYDEEKIKANWESIKVEPKFYPSQFVYLVNWASINPFDLWVFKNYLLANNIQSVVEFGCGSTSKLLDNMGIKRFSIAYEDFSHSGIDFHYADLHDSNDLILEKCADADLVIVDAWHSTKLAQSYHQALKQIDLPIYMHDWYLPGEITFGEQNYWIQEILYKDYEPFIITRVLNKRGYDMWQPPCSAIFTKVKQNGN
jgi:hypothetical protein